MKDHAACKTTILGKSQFCSVTRCAECNLVHLHVGPLSIRLRNDVFTDLCETLMEIYEEQYPRHKHMNMSMHSH